jgi:lysophospholipase L1-like esterase
MALAGCGAPVETSEAATEQSATTGQWVDSWATANQLVEPSNLPPAPGLNGNTLRQIVRTSVGGTWIRLQLSNRFGNSAVVMDSVHLARSTSGSTIDTTTDRAVLFGGSASVTIPAGQEVFSDPFFYNLPALSKMAITIHFASQVGNVTGHPGSRTTSYLKSGNFVTAATLTSAVTTDRWYFIMNLNVFSPLKGGSVITLGDSITDGRGSTTNGNNRWPDVLASRLQANGTTVNNGVGNEGIGGNGVFNGLGPSALSRFNHDVVQQRTPRWVIVLIGVNDIGGSSSQQIATDLINAYQQMINQARAAGIKAYGVPILPFGGSSYDTSGHQTSRNTVNNWIRTSGAWDAVIDLDAVVREPTNPARLRAAYDSGDHLHLNPAGYAAMANAINLSLFNP